MPERRTETFGDVIRELQGSLTQRKFADLAAGVSNAYVNDWLQNRVPRLKTLVQVADALESAGRLTPSQRARLFTAAGYVDPRPASTGAEAGLGPVDLKSFFTNRIGNESPFDRLLRLFGELVKWAEEQQLPKPVLDSGFFGGWDTLTDADVDDYIERLRDEAIRAGKRRERG